ncbi:hypothetical protein HZS_4557 [Henneguya salminicola]|nr:hypothetical protein HZS_4557 [Henneguya salminicola]
MKRKSYIEDLDPPSDVKDYIKRVKRERTRIPSVLSCEKKFEETSSDYAYIFQTEVIDINKQEEEFNSKFSKEQKETWISIFLETRHVTQNLIH